MNLLHRLSESMELSLALAFMVCLPYLNRGCGLHLRAQGPILDMQPWGDSWSNNICVLMSSGVTMESQQHIFDGQVNPRLPKR